VLAGSFAALSMTATRSWLTQTTCYVNMLCDKACACRIIRGPFYDCNQKLGDSNNVLCDICYVTHSVLAGSSVALSMTATQSWLTQMMCFVNMLCDTSCACRIIRGPFYDRNKELVDTNNVLCDTFSVTRSVLAGSSAALSMTATRSSLISGSQQAGLATSCSQR
jgi:hypothetical protein